MFVTTNTSLSRLRPLFNSFALDASASRKAPWRRKAKFASSVRPVRDLRRQQFIEFEISTVSVNHSIIHGRHNVIERRASLLDELGPDS